MKEMGTHGSSWHKGGSLLVGELAAAQSSRDSPWASPAEIRFSGGAGGKGHSISKKDFGQVLW